jgi:stage II sporulation protein M
MNIMKKKRKNNFFYRNYQEVGDYIGGIKKQIYFVIYLFLIFVVIALIFPTPDFISTQISELIKSLAERTKDLNTSELIWFIFKNNFSVSIIGVVFGLVFCIIPFILTAANGYVIGYVIKMLIEKLGFFSGIANLWRLFPHGIFEIPAIIISLAIGIKLGLNFIESLNKNSFRGFGRNLILIFKTILFVILPLLIIAAVIEGCLIGILG